MSARHTPGPWAVEETGPALRYTVTAGVPLAMTYGQAGQQGDARLMAAAPDLLAARLLYDVQRARRINLGPRRINLEARRINLEEQ